MDLFFGMRVVSFGTFVLGVSTFTLSGWTCLSNELANNTFESNGCDNYTDSNDTVVPYTGKEAFESFRTVVFHATVIVVLVEVIQVASAAVILGSPLQGCRERTKIWFTLNIGVNITLILCFVMTVMFASELNNKFPSCFHEIRTQILHLDSFYIGVAIDFFIQFHALVACLILLRFDRGREYRLVEYS